MIDASPDNRLIGPIDEVLRSAHASWSAVVEPWLGSVQAQTLCERIDARLAQGAVIYPRRPLRALELTPLDKVRVVILGQDPYHGAGQAQGLAFSVTPGMRLPPSLRNILQEVARDCGEVSHRAQGGDLSAWAEQGVLLLNTSLTVEDGEAGSHASLGWQALTDKILAAVARHPRPKVFMLWGAHAQARQGLVNSAGAGHLLLCANHPSPLSARRPPVPFLGCGHFSRALDFLRRLDPQSPSVVW